MRAVDTNVLVRLIVRDHAKQVAAAGEFVAGGAWVSHLVLAEAMWVLDSVYDLTPRRIALAVEMLLSHEQFAIQDSEVVEEALADFREKPKLGFSDCLIVHTARKAGHVPVGTFDRTLGNAEHTVRI